MMIHNDDHHAMHSLIKYNDQYVSYLNLSIQSRYLIYLGQLLRR